MINRILSNAELMKEIEDNFYMDDCEKITIHVLVFEETGLMDLHLFINEEYLDCDILSSENDMIGLQKEIKEIGNMLVYNYNIIPEVEFTLFDGLKPEYVYGE